jgi:hypothetical protein
MYLHIGNGVSVKDKNIIGIFDLDSATVSKISKNFINKLSKEGAVEYLDDDLPRSFIVTDTDKKTKVKLSRISTQGLKMRAEMGYEDEK